MSVHVGIDVYRKRSQVAVVAALCSRVRCAYVLSWTRTAVVSGVRAWKMWGWSPG